MYSRYPDRLPEHYSGCAFRPSRAELPPISVPFSESPPSEPPPLPCGSQPISPPSPPKPAPCDLFGGALPTMPGGLAGDELLLLGLILLLARSESGAETLPWLALLLFCK